MRKIWDNADQKKILKFLSTYQEIFREERKKYSVYIRFYKNDFQCNHSNRFTPRGETAHSTYVSAYSVPPVSSTYVTFSSFLFFGKCNTRINLQALK